MVVTSNCIIRAATANDIPMLTHLMNGQYNNKFTQEYFLWQYFNKVNENTFFCALYNSEIIGCFGVLPKRLNNGMNCLQAADMLLQPTYRGKGIFAEMANTAISNFKQWDFCFVLPNLNGKVAVEKNLKWQCVCSINEWQLQVREFIGSIDSSPALQAPKQLIRFEYNEELINWRFNNPLYRYRKESLGHPDYLYAKTFTDRVNGREFVDVVYTNSDHLEQSSLHRYINSVENNGKRDITISCWAMPGTQRANMLASLGFHEIKKERYLCINAAANNSLKNPMSWDVQQADTEFY